MKLHLSQAEGLNQITSCGPGFVAVNGKRHERSLLVAPRKLVEDWPVTQLADLDQGRLALALDLDPEVLLLGTGTQLHFPPPELLRGLIEAKIGYEVMDTGAACRTYNILMSEGRRVLAALIIG
jgi:uncharacterized protein